MFDADGRGDREAAFGFFDEHIAWDARGIPLPELHGVYHGHDGVRRWWRTWLDAWERVDIIDGAHHRANGNQVASWWRQRNLGKGSGIAIEQEAGFVWTFQNGLIVRAAIFVSHAEVFRAAGLEP